MSKTKLKPHTLSRCAMVISLSVLYLYAAEMLPAGCFVFAFLACLCMEPLAEQRGAGLISFIAVTLLGFFLLPSRLIWFFYVAVLGHYGLMRNWLYARTRSIWLRTGGMLLYTNVFLVAWGFVFHIAIDISVLDFFTTPLPLLIILAEAGILMLGVLYHFCSVFYQRKLKRFFP
ncbi:MAG: hypothetical protein FWF10_09935 [Clostridiales bacterium]|nr:hypothetical protein [Clostridiales bacterium]